MPQPAHLAQGQALRTLAFRLHNLAFDVEEPRTDIRRAEALIAEGEALADQVRAVFRGNGRQY
jgi:hypothetical protein